MTHPEPQPLRVRQRNQLVNEIRDAALTLFAERGFDTVTVDDVAAAVGISKSTFFRVVTTKESLLIDPLMEGISGFVAAFEARIPDTDIFDTGVTEAFIGAMVDCMTAADTQEFDRWRAAINTAPHLIGRVTLVTAADRAALCSAAAQRMGGDTATDPRPALLIAVALAASEHVFQGWISDTRRQTVPLARQVEHALRIVLYARWNDPTEEKAL